jgi:uncharacterized protein
MRRFVAWRGLDDWRAEACSVRLGDDGLSASGVQVGRSYRLGYELATDAGLLTRSLVLALDDARGIRTLELLRHDDGSWTAGGNRLPDVEGALDCDLALSPLTNFMPARRLDDAPVDHVMAWVDVPSLEVLRSEQRYEPMDERRVRFVGLEDGFTAVLELDEDGLVTRYPGLAERA